MQISRKVFLLYEMLQIKNLAHTPPEALFKAWDNAFSEYARSWTFEELQIMLQRRSYNATLSFGAFDGDELVGFILNGSGHYNGIYTAYDTGTGVIKSYRGRNITAQIFGASLLKLKAAGIKQYLLEVLSDNETAINIYNKAGFKINRTLNYYIQSVADIKLISSPGIDNYSIVHVQIKDVEDKQDLLTSLPSWQNTLTSVANSPKRFVILAVYKQNELVGYGIVEPATGDVPQLAINKEQIDNGIASGLLSKMLSYNKSNQLRFINVDSRDTTMQKFLAGANISLSGSQLEMSLQLD
ncbi:MAG: GNAT family N-acetyltransferase [Sphingobacteriales bacterium]|nr:MAG: GNAT family N-acetyltransferase [Sphingobacteriales bacterium]